MLAADAQELARLKHVISRHGANRYDNAGCASRHLAVDRLELGQPNGASRTYYAGSGEGPAPCTARRRPR